MKKKLGEKKIIICKNFRNFLYFYYQNEKNKNKNHGERKDVGMVKGTTMVVI